jgi:hypothetical protein
MVVRSHYFCCLWDCSVVLIVTAVLLGYLAHYYREQAFKTVLADNLNVQNVLAHLVRRAN